MGKIRCEYCGQIFNEEDADGAMICPQCFQPIDSIKYIDDQDQYFNDDYNNQKYPSVFDDNDLSYRNYQKDQSDQSDQDNDFYDDQDDDEDQYDEYKEDDYDEQEENDYF